jgi:uncharacterized protein (TIGR04255 family)
MAEIRQLSRSPLREAIIDFRVAPRDDLSPESFEAVRGQLRDNYPKVQQQWLFEGQVHLGEEIALAPEGERRLNGLIFRSEDGTRVAQFRTDGFTFSRLEPYTDWGEVFPEALEHWQLYVDVARPQYVTRLATRYINGIRLGLPLDLNGFFTAAPTLPPNIHHELAGYILRTTSRDPASDIWVHLTQALEELVVDEYVKIVLDIDAFKNVEIGSAEREEMIGIFASLRETKNHVFFEAISERLASDLE